MAKIVDRPTDGNSEFSVAWSAGGLMGAHYTVWGKGKCFHVYNDEESCPLEIEELLFMVEKLESK